MNETKDIKPFSREYVVRVTARHMRRNVNISIEKTAERIKDFEGNPEKSGEVLKTLSDLYAMRRQIDAFASHHGGATAAISEGE